MPVPCLATASRFDTTGPGRPIHAPADPDPRVAAIINEALRGAATSGEHRRRTDPMNQRAPLSRSNPAAL